MGRGGGQVTNSWDRQPMLYLDPGTGATVTAPAMRTISRNFVFRNSFRGPTSNKWGLGEILCVSVLKPLIDRYPPSPESWKTVK